MAFKLGLRYSNSSLRSTQGLAGVCPQPPALLARQPGLTQSAGLPQCGLRDSIYGSSSSVGTLSAVPSAEVAVTDRTRQQRIHAQSSSPVAKGQDPQPPQNDDQTVKIPWDEVNRILQLAAPIFATYTIGHVAYMVDTAFVGHLDNPVLLSGLVLGCSLANVTGYNITRGLASASDTISGQAAGAQDYDALSCTLQRSIAVSMAALVPITALWLSVSPLLVAMGQAPEVAAGAARFLALTVPGLWLYSAADCVERHLVAQSIVKPQVVIAGVKAAITPLCAWFFINHLALGLDGAAFAYCATTSAAAAFTFSYLWWQASTADAGSPAARVSLVPSLSALKGWGPYLGLALPAVLMTCMEGWAVEALIFFAGGLQDAEVSVGATGLCLQLSTLVWVTAAAIASASGTRIANALGRADARDARRTVFTGLALALATQLGVGAAAYQWRHELVGLLTTQKDVATMVADAMPVLALCFVFDGQNAVLGATLRAAGRQWTGAALNLAGWWGIGVPLAYWLGVHEGMGINGLWGGFAAASGVQAALQWYTLLFKLDFEEEARKGAVLLSTQGSIAESSTSESGVDFEMETDAFGAYMALERKLACKSTEYNGAIAVGSEDADKPVSTGVTAPAVVRRRDSAAKQLHE